MSKLIFQQVINARSAFLSNYEVLDLLRELEATQLAQARNHIRVKKEEGEEATRLKPLVEDVPENLRTIEFEVASYIEEFEFQPTRYQSDKRIQGLVKGLAPYGLTKGEKLQIVNLAPTRAVELWTIVEELEDRLDDTRAQQLLKLVKLSLSSKPRPLHRQVNSRARNPIQTPSTGMDGVTFTEKDSDVDGEYVDENAFVDAGEGAGIEGDLEDMDDDE